MTESEQELQDVRAFTVSTCRDTEVTELEAGAELDEPSFDIPRD